MKHITFFLLFLLYAIVCSAQIIHVPGDHSTIQAAIDVAEEGDTVLVDEGRYYENLHFGSVPITLTSQFLIDGDTSHISKTIIDGSQYSDLTDASVIYIQDLPNSKAVLAGFTITGGAGTLSDGSCEGGGIYVTKCGCTIRNNIIEKNSTDGYGAGGSASQLNLGVSDTLYFFDNNVRYNDVQGESQSGGPIGIFSGKNCLIRFSGNIISNNISRSSGYYKILGGGMYIVTGYSYGNDIQIYNNTISHNELHMQSSHGGGIYVVYGRYDGGNTDPVTDTQVRIYNNLIYGNYSEDVGGGIAVWNMEYALGTLSNTLRPPIDPVIANNTIINNRAAGGSGIFNYDANTLLINNIIWNEVEGSEVTEIFNENVDYCFPQDPSWCKSRNDGVLNSFNNVIRGGWTGVQTISQDPMLDEETFEPSEGSPCIGKGANSVNVGDSWYSSPEFDFLDQIRPGPIDQWVDIGAIESAFSRPDDPTLIKVPIEIGSIQSAIDVANKGDTVLVAEGTYLENINFMGKAITVASEYLIDEDTSHISHTIIDGSQPTNPDSASTVHICNGEDENSKLIGFTIKGGTGTEYTNNYYGHFGGGIQINKAGATIEYNIIEHNNIESPESDQSFSLNAGGIGALNSERIIIKNNIIRHNTLNSGMGSGGAGIFVIARDLLLENNQIYNNASTSLWGVGAGIACVTVNEGDRAIIRNNEIFENGLYLKAAYDNRLSGGGIWIETYNNTTEKVLFYNNLVHHNHSDKRGGGFASRAGHNYIFYNNTFYDNTAVVAGQNLSLEDDNQTDGAQLTGFNNIIACSENPSDNIWKISMAKGEFSYSLISGGWEGTYNIDADPFLNNETYELEEGSPCIGAGADSIEIDNQWIKTPAFDLAGHNRPDQADQWSDIGAMESTFGNTPPVLVAPDTYDVNSGSDIMVTSNEDGYLFIVDAGTGRDMEQIRSNSLQDSVKVISNKDAGFIIQDPQNMEYALYAVDMHRGISEKHIITVSGVVGIEEVQTEHLLIYPNPTEDQITLHFNRTRTNEVRIYSMTSQLIFAESFTGNEHQIDLSTYPEGIYFITVRSEGFTAKQKVVKR